jgi:hypothetical protein
MNAKKRQKRLRKTGPVVERTPPVIEAACAEEAAEVESTWRTYSRIVPALDYLAAQGIIEPKPEGASWANTLIVLTEKGKKARLEAVVGSCGKYVAAEGLK